MYTTIIVPRKFKEKVYNRKQWIKFKLLMKRKYATQSGNLSSTTQKKVAERMVELSTSWNNNFERILKWADH